MKSPDSSLKPFTALEAQSPSTQTPLKGPFKNSYAARSIPPERRRQQYQQGEYLKTA